MDRATNSAKPPEDDIQRKQSQEAELDLLFAEEYACDPQFLRKVFATCLPVKDDLSVEDVVIQPKLQAGGFGDLFVYARAMSEKYALLIEHKITAGPAIRQAERYRTEADRLRAQGIVAMTVLVAPRSYVGESHDYDCRLDLEDMADWLCSPDDARLAWRRSRILLAIEKKTSSGVQVHDEAVAELHRRYTEVATEHCRTKGIPLHFPVVKARYYDGDSWIHRIRHPDLPGGMFLRHRLWTSVGHDRGQVDLILSDADETQKSIFSDALPDGAFGAPYSKAGIQASFAVPALKPHEEFSAEAVQLACEKMAELVAWYIG